MLIDTHQVKTKKLSSSSSTKHKTKGWEKIDPIAKRIFITAGFDEKNLSKWPPNTLNQALEAQTGDKMRSYFKNPFKGESLSCTNEMF